MHPSTDKSHFSPSHSLKNTLNFHNSTSSQDSAHRTKAAMAGNQENCNASPLKNVYFSHYESENINSIHSKNFEKGHVFQYETKPNPPTLGRSKALPMHQSPNNYLQSYSSGKKYDFQQEHLAHNGSLGNHKSSDGVTVIKEKYKQKPSSYKVKPEKSLSSDCKYQKRPTPLVQEYKNSEMFNIPTSVLQHAKIEPKDKYFLPSCSSTAPSCMSYATSGPFFVSKDLSSEHLRTGYQKDLSSDHLRTGYQKDLSSDHLRASYQKDLSSDLRAGYQKDLASDHLRAGYQKDLSADLRTSYQNSIYQNSCSLGKPWHYSDLPAISLDSYFRAPEAARPPAPQNHVSSALHEGLISIAQTAPQDVGRVAHSSQQPPAKRKAPELDDDVQIIGVQTKHTSGEF